ncbi:putative ankyrin repeat protein [Chloropicon roscoffensis]|uniref:Ankyrin repeat protein n=1 Tax=Chloropicon roscoffensis TaxID=1461544 RepID=A0AAX4PIH4_9CHLO
MADHARAWWCCGARFRRSSEAHPQQGPRESPAESLPDELWLKILEDLSDSDMCAMAGVCKRFRRLQVASGRKLEISARDVYDPECPLSEDWCYWQSRSRTKSVFHKAVIIDAAARRGFLGVLKFWKKTRAYKKSGMTEWACVNAAQGGHLDVLKFLVAEGCPFNRDEICDQSALHGHIHVLEWLRWERGAPLRPSTCASAAAGGHLEVLKWLVNVAQCPFDVNTCVAAAKAGHLDVLKWARANGAPWDENVTTAAAYKGRLEALIWMREQDPPCPWNADMAAAAAFGGHLDVLKWVRSQSPQAPWDEKTCTCAAKANNLEILQWVRAQDPPCPWNWMTVAAARGDYGQNELLNWALENGCPGIGVSISF